MGCVALKMHNNPTVRLRRLASELRRLRAGVQLSRESVSERTGINGTTLYRIETARTRPQARTLMALLDLYGVEREQKECLLRLSKESTHRDWRRAYQDELPETYAAYVSLEAEAASVCNYESLCLPGLLQTEEYARVIVRAGLPMATAGEVEYRVRARLERQSVLFRAEPLRFCAIVDEAVLRRQTGGVEVMRAQFRHLVVAAPHVTLQVVPFGAGAHAAMSGAFVVMNFTDPVDTEPVTISV